MIRYLSKFLYIVSSRKKLSLLALMFVFTSLLEAVGIGLVGPFVTFAANPDLIHENKWLNQIYNYLQLQFSVQFIPILGFSIIVILAIKALLQFFVQTQIYRFAFEQEGTLTSRLLRGYLTVPYTFHLSRNSASLINNTIVEVNRFIHGGMLPLLNSTSHLAIISALLILLAYTSLPLLLMLAGALLPIFILFHQLGGIFKRWGKASSEARQKIIKTINHGLGGLKETRVIGCEPFFLEQVDKEILEHQKVVTLFFNAQYLPRIFIETTLIVLLIVYISSAQTVFNQSFQDVTSLMGVFAFASVRLIPSSSQLIQGMANLRNTSHILDVLYADLREIERPEGKYEHDSSSVRSKLSSEKPTVTEIAFDKFDLDGIFYRYPNTSDWSISDVSFSLCRGESIALIGKSGAGKTTLVDIILGLLIPDSGDILVSGKSIYRDLRSWQNLLGYIPQSIFLTDDSIERNIAFGVPDHLIDYQKLERAVQAAQLTTLVKQLPEGLKTTVGERGVRLSGGQRQRVGIARALYHDREILVLDEATAALDTETEQLVSESIQALSGKKTMIIIAHRLSTVKHCDRVYLLERGRIAKSGSYQNVVG